MKNFGGVNWFYGLFCWNRVAILVKYQTCHAVRTKINLTISFFAKFELDKKTSTKQSTTAEFNRKL